TTATYTLSLHDALPISTHGMDHGFCINIDLLAQVGDIQLDDVGLAIKVVVPYVIQDLRLGNHAAGVVHQVAEQIEFGGGQRNLAACPGDIMRVRIQHQVANDQFGGVGGGRAGTFHQAVQADQD